MTVQHRKRTAQRRWKRAGPPLLVQFLTHAAAGRIVAHKDNPPPPNLGFNAPAIVLEQMTLALEAIWHGWRAGRRQDAASALGLPRQPGRRQWLDIDLAVRLDQLRKQGDSWDAIQASCVTGELAEYLRKRSAAISEFLTATGHAVPEYKKMLKPALGRASLIRLHELYSQQMRTIS